jgi:hypothetical protein
MSPDASRLARSFTTLPCRGGLTFTLLLRHASTDRRWDSFERFLAWQVEHSDGREEIYFASEGLETSDEPVSAQRLRLRQQAQQWRTGSVPVAEREVRAVKIGRSSRDPARRLQEVNVGNYRPLFEVCVIPVHDAVVVERELHRAFAKEHLRGEWYALSPNLHIMIGILMECAEAKVLKRSA